MKLSGSHAFAGFPAWCGQESQFSQWQWSRSLKNVNACLLSGPTGLMHRSNCRFIRSRFGGTPVATVWGVCQYPLRECELGGQFQMSKDKRLTRKQYSAADLRVLRRHSQARTPTVTVAKLMGRSVGSLQQKCRRLGIPLGHRPYGKKRHATRRPPAPAPINP
jgi:hypothetical protein